MADVVAAGIDSPAEEGLTCGWVVETCDLDLLRERIGFAAWQLMDLETEGLCGAAHGERCEARPNQRNGYLRIPTSVGH